MRRRVRRQGQVLQRVLRCCRLAQPQARLRQDAEDARAAHEAARATRQQRGLLHTACDAVREGDAAALARALEQGAPAGATTNAAYEDFPFCTLLHLCCFYGEDHGAGKLECLNLLAAQPDVDLNARMGDPHMGPGCMNTRETPLHIACMYHADAALRLLALGARPDLVDWGGTTALSRLRKSGHSSAKKAAIEAAMQTASSQDTGAVTRADALREEGNAAFRAGDDTVAQAKYEASLEARVDGRTLNNLAALHLRRATTLGRQNVAAWRRANSPSGVGTVDSTTSENVLRVNLQLEDAAWTDALRYALQARELNPACPKAAYRCARAQMGIKDFPRALVAAREGAEANPGEPTLMRLVTELRALGVREVLANAMSPETLRMKEMMRSSWGPTVWCPFCNIPLPLPLAQYGGHCLRCACDPETVVPPGKINQLRLE